VSKKYWFMNFVFVDTLVLGTLCGYLFPRLESDFLSALLGFLMALTFLFVGAVLAFMFADDRSVSRRKKLIAELEGIFEEKEKEAIRRDRQIYGAMSVEMAKAVADRVANQIISKHVDGMDSAGVRQAILESANQIVDEEIGILHEAMKREAGI